MTLSLPTALALVAIVVAGFALVAVGGIYARLKQVEHAIAEVTFGGGAQAVPERLRPRPGEAATLLLTLDGECPTCHRLAAAIDAAARTGRLAGLRLVRVFSSAGARSRHHDTPAIETFADPDLWSAVYEGYTPTVSVVDAGGRSVHRRFVYADTDLDALIADARARVAALTDVTSPVPVPVSVPPSPEAS